MEKNYYEILGSETEKKSAEEKIKEINEVKEVLLDPEKRKFYDQYGDKWQQYYNDSKKSDPIEEDTYFEYLRKKIYSFCAECGKRIEDEGIYVQKMPGELFCSKIHAGKNQFREEIKRAREFSSSLDEFNGEIKKVLKRAEQLNQKKKNLVDQERNNFLQQLRNLADWNLLGEERQKKIVEKMKRNRTTDQFRDVLKMLGGKRDDHNDTNLAAEIQKAISEIEAELNKEPKITFIDDNLQETKQSLLNVIRKKRKERTDQKLPELKIQAINDISQATTAEAINEIRDRVLADIRNKRAVVAEKNRLTNILSQIKKLRSSNGYEEKKSEIQAIENRLRELDSKQFKKTEGNLLDQQKEKEELITEILQFIAKNNYQKNAYQKQKSRVDKLLTELQGQKSQDNTQNPPFWKKALVPLLVIGLLGIMITGILIWRRKRLRRKVEWE
ncbi:6112_t:CDS:2 [Gigaspora margarita]|uniref:6112_t:CDS:1 n=1 Tax=Gigaspora margarita TaxID=4874 RepID=A0ABN7UBG7_GIGMA|nr:6112_t:CDS:2 [Gigaspora margarita]